MPVRAKLAVVEGEGSYFSSPKTNHEFISSGCALLDCVIGGGWPLGRISNIVGDKSTGKTFLAIEAAANFVRAFPQGKVNYRESEAAFDQQYAEALGMPVGKIDFGTGDFFTVEDLFEDLTKTVDSLIKQKVPGLYIVDSLDALSDRDELDREIDKGSYGAAKAKKMSELFRRLVKKVEQSSVHLMIISQVRDNFNAGPFGNKHVRSGGRALDFYASQIIMLNYMGALDKTIEGVKRITGIEVRARCTKNKIGLPLREAHFAILFGLGIDRLNASIDWLKDVKRLKVIIEDEKDLKGYLSQINDMSDEDYWHTVESIEEKVRIQWSMIEQSFLPSRKKPVQSAAPL